MTTSAPQLTPDEAQPPKAPEIRPAPPRRCSSRRSCAGAPLLGRYLADMAGLVVAQFTAAAIGIAVALAVVRGIAGSSRRIGNFWADLTRSLVRLLIPAASSTSRCSSSGR